MPMDGINRGSAVSVAAAALATRLLMPSIDIKK